MLEIGLTKHMAMNRTNGYRDMQVWDGVTDARIHLDSALLKSYNVNNAMEENTIAYIVENVNVQSAALKRLDECRAEGSHIDFIQKVKVAEIERSLENKPQEGEGLDLQDWPTVHLDNGRKLKARLLVNEGISCMRHEELTCIYPRLALMVSIALCVALLILTHSVGITMRTVLSLH